MGDRAPRSIDFPARFWDNPATLTGPGGPATRMANQPKRSFHVASEPDIKAGQVSDVYFARTVQILKARGLTKRVKAEIRLKSFPQADWSFGVLAGIEEAAALARGAPGRRLGHG